MFGKIIVDKKEYERLKDVIKSNGITEKYWIDQYMDSAKREYKLTEEIADLKTLLSKEEDTQAIKYNGKLYRVASTTYYKDEAGESLDITAVLVVR